MAKIKMTINKIILYTFLILLVSSNFSFAQKKNIADLINEKIPLENSDLESPDLSNLESLDDENNNSRFVNYAIVQALNKTTAKTSYLELKVGEKFSFGSIRIIPHKCWQSPLSKKPENKILLEIFEVKSEGDDKQIEKRIFFGWMFSSSPSISGLEHPIYDIIAINCKLK
jgi:hypothetical protein